MDCQTETKLWEIISLQRQLISEKEQLLGILRAMCDTSDGVIHQQSQQIAVLTAALDQAAAELRDRGS